MTKEERKDFIVGTKFELRDKGTHNKKFVSNPLLGIYEYNNGIYLEDKEAGALKKFISDIRTDIDVATTTEIIEEIRNESYRAFEDFDNNTDLVPLLNYNYNLKTDKIEAFDPTIISTSRIPIKYDPTATCPTINSFLRTIVDPEDIPVVEELFGFLLSKRYEHKYMFILHGGRDSGKSTLLELMERFINGNASHVPPHIIAIDKFAAAELFGKRANISGDISAKMFADTNLLKMLVGNDVMHADKKFGEIFNFRSFAKLIFACNTLPAIPDNDLEVFVEKIKVISIPNTIPKNKQDHTLLGRMTTPEELSGLFNLALEGRRRLKKNNDFSHAITKDQIMERYFAAADPVVKFVREVVEISVVDVTPKDDITKLFEDYCKLKNIKYPKVSITFWKTFKSALPRDIIDYNRKIGGRGEQKYAVGGIRLRSLSEIETTENTTPIISPEVSVQIPTPITISTEKIDYGYDEPSPLPEPETMSPEEIEQLNHEWALIKEQQDLADAAHEASMENHPDNLKAKAILNEQHSPDPEE